MQRFTELRLVSPSGRRAAFTPKSRSLATADAERAAGCGAVFGRLLPFVASCGSMPCSFLVLQVKGRCRGGSGGGLSRVRTPGTHTHSHNNWGRASAGCCRCCMLLSLVRRCCAPVPLACAQQLAVASVKQPALRTASSDAPYRRHHVILRPSIIFGPPPPNPTRRGQFLQSIDANLAAKVSRGGGGLGGCMQGSWHTDHTGRSPCPALPCLSSVEELSRCVTDQLPTHSRRQPPSFPNRCRSHPHFSPTSGAPRRMSQTWWPPAVLLWSGAASCQPPRASL